jgi:hypothetical protein
MTTARPSDVGGVETKLDQRLLDTEILRRNVKGTIEYRGWIKICPVHIPLAKAFAFDILHSELFVPIPHCLDAYFRALNWRGVSRSALRTARPI